MLKIEDAVSRCAAMSDEELWESLLALARAEREDLILFLIHLGEAHSRTLPLKRAYSGSFVLLVELGYSEWEARARSLAAAAARKYPSILPMLRSRRIHLTSLARLVPCLTPENYRSLLAKASNRTTRQIEALVAELQPGAPRRDAVRVVSVGPPPPALPAPSSEDELFSVAISGPAIEGAGARDDVVPAKRAESAVTRLRFSFDADAKLDELLKRARGLLRHKYPYGEMEGILNDALNALLDRIDPDRRIARIERRMAQRERRGSVHVELPGIDGVLK